MPSLNWGFYLFYYCSNLKITVNKLSFLQIIKYFSFSGKERLGYWTQVKNDRWETQLEQSFHQDQGTTAGQGYRLLLWEFLPGENSETQV